MKGIVNGADTVFHITLHWLLNLDLLKELNALMKANNTFETLLQNMTDPKWNNLKPSLEQLLKVD